MHLAQSLKEMTKPKQFLLLYVVTLFAQYAYIAYERYQTGESILPTVLPSLLFLSLLTVPAILIGLHFGPKMGIGLVNNKETHLKPGLAFAITMAIVLGILLLTLRWFLAPYLPSELPEYGFRGPIGGFLVSIGAAIGEEVWFRFGLMTLLLFGLLKITGKQQINGLQFWTVVLVVSLGFGLAHLPSLSAAGAADSAGIWGTILGNVATSILFSWCFWRYGLFAAITAHFVQDIMLHCIPAFF